jgi:hypothetical protein
MKMAAPHHHEPAMSRIPLALMLFVLAPLAQAKEGGTFYCYWIDQARMTVATTGIFPGEKAMADDISGRFASDMRRGAGARGAGRMYDCAWYKSPQEAANELGQFRDRHAYNRFHVESVDWSPWGR